MTKIQIPSGLIDDNIEMFSVNGKVMATHSGVVKEFFELPGSFLETIKNEMEQNENTVSALMSQGYKTHKQQLEKFAECRFGGFDLVPDFKDGVLSEAEYHECGQRGNCPMEGVVCGFFKINNHIITPFEISIIRLLATEDILPVIAEKLNVCMNTFESRKKQLYKKLKVLSRPRLVAIAYEHQILTNLCFTT